MGEPHIDGELPLSRVNSGNPKGHVGKVCMWTFDNEIQRGKRKYSQGR
jgi:hypothetical protein